MRDDQGKWHEHELYRLIFEYAPGAIAIVAEDGRVAELNRAARDFGLDVKAMVEDHVDLASFRAELRANGRARAEMRALTGGGARIVTLDARVLGASFVVRVRDVTDERAEQRELGHLRRVDSLGYLTASMVHDFNNVLTPILLSATLLEQHVGDEGEPSELVAEIRSAAERAASLVHQVLSFTRQPSQLPRPTNVGKVVGELHDLVARIVGESIEVAIESEPALGDVVVDRGQLEHVILNLAANARDAMPRGGRLTIATKNVTLREGEAMERGCPGPGGYLSIVVSDTGVGMAPEIRERIFERFFTTKGEGGTGLGLATAHRFVARSGGCISVGSVPGEGTTVSIFLPRVDAVDTPRPPPRAELPRGDETILVVEDDEHVRRVVRVVLEAQGYAVLDAHTVAAAMEVATAHAGRIDLLLTDVVLPGASGRVLTSELRAVGQEPKVLFMSGHTEKALVDHGVPQDDRLLRKAFSPSELARRVRDVLDD